MTHPNADNGTSLSLVADLNTTLPNIRDSLQPRPNILIDENGRVLFEATAGAQGTPFYGWLSGALSLVVDVPKIIDGTSTEFGDSLSFAVANTSFLITRGNPIQQGTTPQGLYVYQGDTAMRLVERGETLDGKEILFTFPAGIDSDTLVIFVEFLDDSCGLYSVDLVP